MYGWFPWSYEKLPNITSQKLPSAVSAPGAPASGCVFAPDFRSRLPPHGAPRSCGPFLRPARPPREDQGLGNWRYQRWGCCCLSYKMVNTHPMMGIGTDPAGSTILSLGTAHHGFDHLERVGTNQFQLPKSTLCKRRLYIKLSSLYVCICVICVCVNVYIYIYIWNRICTIYIYIHIHVCVSKFMRMYIYIY